MKGYSIKYCLTAGIQAVAIDPVHGAYRKGHIYKRGDYVYGDDEYHQQLRYGIDFFVSQKEAIQAAEAKASRQVAALEKKIGELRALALKARFA